MAVASRASQPQEKIRHVCDAIREELEIRDLKKYINAILTSHVVKSPPDYEGGLSLLLRLQGCVLFSWIARDLTLTFSLETEKELVHDAVKFIIFLVDTGTLYNAALGMYDFSLVMIIAQEAQMVSLLTSALIYAPTYIVMPKGSKGVSTFFERASCIGSCISTVPNRRPPQAIPKSARELETRWSVCSFLITFTSP